MGNLVLYVHGAGGTAAEAEHYAPFFVGSDVIGFDYKSKNLWDAKNEFANFFSSLDKKYKSVTIIANSIGAFFVMHALANERIERAIFISPIVNMEKIITDMMKFSNVTEDELRDKKEIATERGENLSWKYLCYVRENPIAWKIPTHILYGAKDNLTSMETMTNFARKIGATLTIMENGEHWFHTTEQMKFLDGWLKKIVERKIL